MLDVIRSLVNEGYSVAFKPGFEFDNVVVYLEKYGFRKRIAFSKRYFENHPDSNIVIPYELKRATIDFYK